MNNTISAKCLFLQTCKNGISINQNESSLSLYSTNESSNGVWTSCLRWWYVNNAWLQSIRCIPKTKNILFKIYVIQTFQGYLKIQNIFTNFVCIDKKYNWHNFPLKQTCVLLFLLWQFFILTNNIVLKNILINLN
jgi:hypothetical protein